MGNSTIKGRSQTALTKTLGPPQRFVLWLTTLLLLALGCSSADAGSFAPMQPSPAGDPHYLIALNSTPNSDTIPNLAFNVPPTPSFAAQKENSQWDVKWLTAAPELVGFDTTSLNRSIEQIGQMSGVYSVIVVRNGYLASERYFREGYRIKPHNIKSATKSVLSALTGIAINKGYLRLDQPISDFLPRVKNLDDPRKNDITVRHLLTMTSGLDPTSYQAYNSWIMNGSDWVKIILDRPMVAAPGTKHQYSTGDTHILSAVLTAATRMSTREFAARNLFNPLGVTIHGWEIDPQGINQGGNNLSLIPLDMALLGQVYLDGGRFRNRQVIPKWWVDVSTRPNYLGGEQEVYGYYGYLWYSRPGGQDAFVAVGYGGQYIYISPEYQSVVVITSTLESKGREWEKELFNIIRNGILGSIQADRQQLLQVEYRDKSPAQVYQNDPIASRIVTGENRMGMAIANLNLRNGPSRN
ncbi:MAG: serine hydrolase, partial [Proteobacteria bacterium]|nr:serine hydrolase [Pseudomonadota bacterium]